MIVPLQTKGIRRAAFPKHMYASVSEVGAGGVLPQLRLGGRLTQEERCYYSYIGSGVPDLVARFFCGLRPFTIGGLLIADRSRI